MEPEYPYHPRAALERVWLGRQLRGSLPLFAEHAMRRDGLAPAPHHHLLLRELASLKKSAQRRLMVFMPPGSAKSTYVSVVFPTWFLANGPYAVLAASHTVALADNFSRRVRQMAQRESLLGWRPVSERATEWATSRGGVYRATGVGSGIAGFRADLGIIDDPMRSRADADSPRTRDRLWDWYRADFLTRLRPQASQVLVMTRWHEDDLAGRLLMSEPNAWRLLRLPAFAEAGDALGRSPGEPLWDDDYGYAGQLREMRRFYEQSGGMRDWHALYQQSPKPDDGTIFRIDRMPVFDAFDAVSRVRGWDLAATAATSGANPDWTVGALIGRDAAGRFAVLDICRLRGGPDDVERAIILSAQRDGPSTTISLPQDPGQAGKAQAQWLTRALAGYTVHSSPEGGNKTTRAAPLASQCNQGNVGVLRSSWTPAFLDELKAFPTGSKDDQVDAAARAFMTLANQPAAARAINLPYLSR